jgi:mannose-6-phosphate isomerase-like protein (cupin superfamily)
MKIIRFGKIDWQPASHENPQNPGVLKKVMVKVGDMCSGKLQMINWAKMKPQKQFSAHYHEDMDEIFIITSGKAEIKVDKETEILQKGDAIIIPQKSVHMMKNIGDKDAFYIAIGISEDKDGKTVNV